MSISDVIPARLDAAVQTATGTELTGSGSIGRAVWALILAFGLAHLLLAVVLPLTPQEAYYWLWSRDLAWSYFDHPPLVAWSIAAATAVFGPSSWAIKLAAVGWSFAFSVVWARLVIDIGGSRSSAFWTLLALNLIGIVAAYRARRTADLRVGGGDVDSAKGHSHRRNPVVVARGPCTGPGISRQVHGGAFGAGRRDLSGAVTQSTPLAATSATLARAHHRSYRLHAGHRLECAA